MCKPGKDVTLLCKGVTAVIAVMIRPTISPPLTTEYVNFIVLTIEVDHHTEGPLTPDQVRVHNTFRALSYRLQCSLTL